MFRKYAAALLCPSLFLAGCGSAPDPNAKEVDDFAARIGSGAKPAQTAPDAATTPDPAEAAPADDKAAPEDAANANAAADNCAAPKVAPFYGRQADEPTQAAVMAAVAPQTNVRFVEAGSGITEDTGSPRLNVMIDVTGVIRDARCG